MLKKLITIAFTLLLFGKSLFASSNQIIPINKDRQDIFKAIGDRWIDLSNYLSEFENEPDLVKFSAATERLGKKMKIFGILMPNERLDRILQVGFQFLDEVERQTSLLERDDIKNYPEHIAINKTIYYMNTRICLYLVKAIEMKNLSQESKEAILESPKFKKYILKSLKTDISEIELDFEDDFNNLFAKEEPVEAAEEEPVISIIEEAAEEEAFLNDFNNPSANRLFTLNPDTIGDESKEVVELTNSDIHSGIRRYYNGLSSKKRIENHRHSNQEYRIELDRAKKKIQKLDKLKKYLKKNKLKTDHIFKFYTSINASINSDAGGSHRKVEYVSVVPDGYDPRTFKSTYVKLHGNKSTYGPRTLSTWRKSTIPELEDILKYEISCWEQYLVNKKY